MVERKSSGGAEKRREPRRAVARVGVIVHGEPRTVLTGMIRNTSKTGAQVQLAGGVQLPASVYLIDMVAQVAHLCVVEHQRAGRCGLRFLDRHPLTRLPAAMGFLLKIFMDYAQR